MALSWIKRSKRPVSVDDLVARGKYARALDLMREEFAERFPSATDRLRYADVLVLAGREAEAVPVLLGVADEQERYGFPDKALEALRRAVEIDPEHPEVNDRLEALRSLPSEESQDDPAEDLRAASDGWASALDGAFAETMAPIDGVAREDGEADTGFDSSMLATPAPGAPRHEGEGAPVAAQVALLSDDDVEAVPGPFDEPAARSAPELDPSVLEPADEDLGVEGPSTPLEEEEELHEFVLALGRRQGFGRSALGAIFFDSLDREELRRVASGLHPRYFTPGETVVQKGEAGSSVFLIASGAVRVLVMGGHGQPFEIRQIEEGDFFCEVAALSGRPRSATVVAASACEMLEIDREALEVLVGLRPAARVLLDEACVERALSPEESAVRSLPPEAADPARAAAALRAHFGDCNWSPRVRLHLARLMLDVGRQGDALAILAGVAEDLARNGQAKKAISVLKKVETIQRRGIREVCLAPLKAGRRTSSARRAARRRAAPRAVKEAAFREWVGSLLRETAMLAERSAGAVQEEAEAPGEEQRRELAW
jgi:hypothetical protein